ncbi:hypothetical protein BKI52_00285 [marine bacterium AO1-C]|nr:hypothetical protein BKI52_00285 [marine bacterium AO1-C]
MKSFVFCLALVGLISLQTQGQVSSAKQQIYNQYVEFNEQMAQASQNIIKCLHYYYKSTQAYKTGKKKVYRIAPPNCSKYQLGVTKVLAGGIPSLNAQVQAMWTLFKELREHEKDLNAYCIAKTYTQDNFAHSDKVLTAIQKIFDQLQAKSTQLQQDLINLVAQQYNTSNPHQRLAKQMREIIDVEDKLQTKILFNLHNGKFEQAHGKLRIENIKQLYGLLAKLPETNNIAIKGLALSAYKRFVGTLQGLLNSRGKQWNRSAVGYQRTSSFYSSRPYTRLLINEFNRFVKDSKWAKVYLLKHSRPSYRFTLQKPIDYKQEKPVFQAFSDTPSPGLSLLNHPQPPRQKAIDALNSYIECINRSIVKNDDLIKYINSMHTALQQIKQGTRKEADYPHYFSRNYFYPKSLFCKVRQLSIALPTSYLKVLNAQMDQLEEVLKEMAGLDYGLNHYLKNKDYQKDNFTKAQKVICRYQYLYNIFDDKRSALVTNIYRIQSAYPAHKKPLPTATTRDLLRILDFGKPVMDATHVFLRKGTKDAFNEHLADSLVYAFYNPVMKLAFDKKTYRSARKAHRYIEHFVKAAELTNQGKGQASAQNISQLYEYNVLVSFYNAAVNSSKSPLFKKVRYLKVLSLDNPCDYKSSQTNAKATNKKNNHKEVNMTSMQGFAPNNLMLLLDVSGSMKEKNKLPLLKQSLKYLVNIMRPEDEVSIVVYAGDAAVVLEPTSAAKQTQINEVIDQLRSLGKTNVKAGFKLAYKWMTKNYKENGNNRIILATDGEFPIDKYIYKMVGKRAEKGIYLSVFSFGNNDKKYKSLQQLVEKGKGNYEHIDSKNANYKLVKEAQSTQIK